MDSSEDTDARKKRDSPNADDTPPNNGTSLSSPEKKNQSTMHEVKTRGGRFKRSVPDGDSTVEPVDVETALQKLVPQKGIVERLSDQAVVTFRAGHTGDAPAIESYYQQAWKAGPEKANEKEEGDGDKSSERTNVQQEEPSSSLELWLSEAMGDEDTPPSLFSVLAEVSALSEEEEDTPSKPNQRLGAVALFTLAWKDRQRMILLEWFHVDKALPETHVLKHRMWLLLSALALMTGACLHVTHDFRIDGVEVTANHGEIS